MNSPDTYRKHRPDAPAGFFAAEAAGLAWLADAAAVPVVGVRSVGPDAIELERLHTVAPGATASTTFGRQLCDLHDARAPHFGAPPPGAPAHGYIGDAPLSYAPAGRHARWGSFYAAERVLPYARAALARGDLTTAGWRSPHASASFWTPATSTTTPRPRGCTATCGRATCCSRRPG